MLWLYKNSGEQSSLWILELDPQIVQALETDYFTHHSRLHILHGLLNPIDH